MRYLIQTLINRRDGGVDYDDADARGDAISIGQATDQDIQLAEQGVAPQHALIHLGAGGRVRVRALTAAPLSVNGETTRAAELKIGDVLSVGASRIERIAAPRGFDLALQLSRGAADLDHNRYRVLSTRLAQTGLRKRRWSWALGLGFLLFGFGLPFAGALIEPLGRILHETPLPSDRLWVSGPLQAAHRTPEIRDDCQVCHAKAFRTVKNEQCVACHTEVGQHVDPQAHQVADLHQADCAGCHREHNEPSGTAHRDQRLCSDCHSELEDNTGVDSRFADVGDFGTAHPGFHITMLTPPEGDPFQSWPSLRAALAERPQENSHLLFPHDKHLDPEGVRAPDGKEMLGCDDCHQIDAGGEYLMPIVMEQHCQRCHLLGFDEDAPERQAPHGEPDRVVQALEEYFSRKYLEQSLGEQTETGAGGRLTRARRPGEALSDEQRALVLSRARASAADAATLLFDDEAELAINRSNCVKCHVVSTDTAASGSAEPLSRWRVLPVRLTHRWMPHAVFDHASHRAGMEVTRDGEQLEDCAVCHAAADSSAASDVLMPDIGVCRECHSGQRGQGVASTCVSCHRFHLAERGVMR